MKYVSLISSCIISLRGDIWAHKTSWSLSLFIEVPVPCQESECSFICVWKHEIYMHARYRSNGHYIDLKIHTLRSCLHVVFRFVAIWPSSELCQGSLHIISNVFRRVPSCSKVYVVISSCILYGHIISLRGDIWVHKTSLTPSLFYWSACTKLGKWMFVCLCLETWYIHAEVLEITETLQRRFHNSYVAQK